jgi:hypothetical protein
VCKAPWLCQSSWECPWKYPYICSSDPLIDTDVVVHGQGLGLVKNLAVVAYIIVGSAVNPVLELSSWKSGV